MNHKHTSAVLVVMLLLGSFVVSTTAADEPTATTPVTPNSPETEPNDTFDTASFIEWDRYGVLRPAGGTIDPAGDVDIYQFATFWFDAIEVTWHDWSGPLTGVLSLYDAGGVLLAENTCTPETVCLHYAFGRGGAYFLKVANATGSGGPNYAYRLTFARLETTDVFEPNDTPEQATPVAYDQDQVGLLSPCGDVDYFTFVGSAGDELYNDNRYNWALDLLLLDAGQNIIAEGHYEQSLHTRLPVDGVYYLRVSSTECDSSAARWYDFTLKFLDQPLYVSFDRAGQIRTIPFTSGDILRYWTATDRWEMYLDLSDVGLNGNVTAMGCWPNYYAGPRFSLGFSGKYTLPDGTVVMPQDLIGFIATSTGDDTAGELEILFDGSDVGLTTSAERLDADAGFVGPLSTAGRAKVPQNLSFMTVEDEDLMSLYDANLGPNTTGTWQLAWDGSAHGLAAADIVAAAISDDWRTWTTSLYLVFDRPVALGGIAFAAGDVIELNGDDVNMFFDASEAGLTGIKIDAIHVGYKE